MEHRWFWAWMPVGKRKIWSSLRSTREEVSLHGSIEDSFQIGNYQRPRWKANLAWNRNSISITVWFAFIFIIIMNWHWNNSVHLECWFSFVLQSSEYFVFVYVFPWREAYLFGSWTGFGRWAVSSFAMFIEWLFPRDAFGTLYVSSCKCSSLLSFE